MIANLTGLVEDGRVYAAGKLSNGSLYLAVADDWPELHERIRESAAAEGWLGWALVTSSLSIQ